MIRIQDHGPVRELRLDRPPANALIPELVSALRSAVEAAPGEGVKALVLSGTPGRFSGGLDVPFLVNLDRPAIAEAWRDFYAMLRSLAASPIPIVAAITGHSPAGGAVMAIFCDTRIMAEGDFVIGLNEVQVSIPLPPVILHALRLVVGHRQAERLAVTGQLVTAAEALRIGLVDELVAPERVVERAVEQCNGLLALPSHAMSVTRGVARAELISLFGGRTESEVPRVVEQWFSPETRAGLEALVEKLTSKKAR